MIENKALVEAEWRSDCIAAGTVFFLGGVASIAVGLKEKNPFAIATGAAYAVAGLGIAGPKVRELRQVWRDNLRAGVEATVRTEAGLEQIGALNPQLSES